MHCVVAVKGAGRNAVFWLVGWLMFVMFVSIWHSQHRLYQRLPKINNYSQLEKPSLEVAPTSLLLIYSFPVDFEVCFSKRNCCSQSDFYFYPKNISSCDLELWPMTLTYKLDPVRVQMNHRARYIRQRGHSVRKLRKVIVRTHTHTHTHSRLTALPGPLNGR